MTETEATVFAWATFSPDAAIVEDADGNVVEFNAAAERLFGYLRADVIGRPLAERTWAEPWPDGATPGRERLFRRGDGSTFIGDVSASPTRTADGPFLVIAVRDITAQKAIEARLREQCRSSREGIALAAHELRAPLNAIIGFCQLLLEGDLTADSERHDEVLGCVLISSRSLLRLVNDILASARSQAALSGDDPDGTRETLASPDAAADLSPSAW